MTDKKATTYFDILADIGVTKHYGSLTATNHLAGSCRINQHTLVLDVGCGVGATPSLLAKSRGAKIIGVDLIEKMILQARKWAQTHQVADQVVFAAADARWLPFPDNHFDVVMMESLNVFFDDKLSAIREYLRVTKPGGYVGMTEMTWLQTPPPELERLFRNSALATALDEKEWLALLDEAGMVEVAGNAFRIDVSEESKGRMERYGLLYVIKALFRTLYLTLTSKTHREMFKAGSGGISREVLDIVGYGVYYGRKRSDLPT